MPTEIRMDDYRHIARLWILRALSRPEARPRLRHVYETTSILETLGFRVALSSESEIETLEALDKTGPKDARQRVIASQVDAWLTKATRTSEELGVSIPDPLARNLDLLAARLRLTEVEKGVLAIRAVYEIDDDVRGTIDALEAKTDPRLARLLAAMLCETPAAVSSALDPRGSLTSLRLIDHSTETASFSDRVQPIPGLVHALLSVHRSMESLLSFVVQLAPAPSLGDEHYPHLREHLELLTTYLGHALRARQHGVNVLMHGRPGVGKTELARIVAHKVNASLYEVPEHNVASHPLQPGVRQQSYGLLQGLLARRRNCVILFDELEDVIPYGGQSPFWIEGRRSLYRKAWMNRLLETNQIPTIWVSNEISHVDTAFLRRYSYILKVEVPPRSVRRHHLACQLRSFEPAEGFIDRIAENADIGPSCVHAMRQVLERTSTTTAQLERRFDLLAAERLDAMGAPRTRARYPFPDRWRREYVNADVDIEALTDRLRRSGRGNLLLYGPPGTGKTALAHWLARQLDRPLYVRRASDLHSPWFGETEQRLERMFREAMTDGAVLLLDEADSFLYDRRGAQHSWEVGHVNELLTQMECYDGVFVCATNFRDALDEAASRRFSACIQFSWMRPEQALLAFNDALAKLGIAVGDSGPLHERIRRLDRLTPGDFTAAVTATQFMQQTATAEGLLTRLAEQCKGHHGNEGRAIGFCA